MRYEHSVVFPTSDLIYDFEQEIQQELNDESRQTLLLALFRSIDEDRPVNNPNYGIIDAAVLGLECKADLDSLFFKRATRSLYFKIYDRLKLYDMFEVDGHTLRHFPYSMVGADVLLTYLHN